MEDYNGELARVPDCWCKAGKMVVKVAGPRSPNWKRPYYKCPSNRDDHPRHFIWVDEYHRRQSESRSRATSGIGDFHNRSHSTQTASSMAVQSITSPEATDTSMPKPMNADLQLTIIFMGVVLVMLGVIIGILLSKM